ncbi:MAG: hypothetical protein QM770_03065 [Tepidisphaeraceae bacterium]
MRQWISLVMAVVALMVVGCKVTNKDNCCDPKAASAADVCPHCPGVQTVKADGTCSGCGGKVVDGKCVDCKCPKPAADAAVTPAAATADACSHCEGVQVATADGKCPKCGAKVAAAK